MASGTARIDMKGLPVGVTSRLVENAGSRRIAGAARPWPMIPKLMISLMSPVILLFLQRVIAMPSLARAVPAGTGRRDDGAGSPERRPPMGLGGVRPGMRGAHCFAASVVLSKAARVGDAP
jgi:hypothetical protein